MNTTDSPQESCRRCRTNPSTLLVRTEPLCRDCFIKYIHTKIIKRMETFRVRNSAPDKTRKILLPMSFGVSSVMLLHVLDQHLKNQKTRTGRPGYSLVVVFVDTSDIDGSSPDASLLSQLEATYPDHTYSSIPLHQVLDDSSSSKDVLKEIFPNSLPPDLSDSTPSQKLVSLLSSLPSPTARHDILTTLRTRALVNHAQTHSCEAILWSDSTTSLASKTLSETAKGRGYSLPWKIADGESPFGLTFQYPLRDLLRKEIVTYAEITEPPLLRLVRKEEGKKGAKSSKNMTIDELMEDYFLGVEESFPSIVSNVVRTSSKLEPSKETAEQPRCRLCEMPVQGGRFGIYGWGGDQHGEGEGEGEGYGKRGLCYGCTRSVPLVGGMRNGSA